MIHIAKIATTALADPKFGFERKHFLKYFRALFFAKGSQWVWSVADLGGKILGIIKYADFD